ncbi:MAG TPA: DedA family protein, partial [Thermodesulfobacteriota bacterium]
MDGPLSPIVARFGYLAVFVGVFLESAGVPVPAETLLLAGGFFAHQGPLTLAWVIAVAAAAAILGDSLGYVLGRRGGRSVIERRGPWVRLTPARLAAIDTLLARHGARAVFFGRFVTGIRVSVAVAAG